jgi:hypothetical protein
MTDRASGSAARAVEDVGELSQPELALGLTKGKGGGGVGGRMTEHVS